jgi:hypothetical protein
MEEERPAADPTRKLLKVFGVKVTDYEAKTEALLRRAEAQPNRDELHAVVIEAVELTADLHRWLGEITSHVLERERDVLERLARHAKAG